MNSAKGRVKDKNMRRKKRVALSIQDPDNAYRYLAVQGEDQGNHRRRRRRAYRFAWPKNTWARTNIRFALPGEVRVIYKIRPKKVSTMG